MRGIETNDADPNGLAGFLGLKAEFTPLEIDEDSMAFGAHEEVGHGGHFLGAMHTMERFRTCFYRPFVNSSDNYDRWMKGGAKDAATRAGVMSWR